MRPLLAFALAVVAAVAAPAPADAVVGGAPATPGLHPQLVSVEIDGNHACGGNLVDHNTILTAAHCAVVDEQGRDPLPAERLKVLAGTMRRSQGGRRIRVASVVVHPGFGTPNERSNDVALLHLARVVRFARPIRLARPGGRSSTWAPGIPALVAGWGTTSVLGEAPEDDLREAVVPLRDTSTCASRYPLALPTSASFDPATNICAGADGGGRDACSYDSGSALTVAGRRGERLLVGLPSFGVGCATPGFPGVYAGVALPALHGWITQHLGAAAPGRCRRPSQRPRARSSARVRRCFGQ